MADLTTVKAITNQLPNSCVEVQCDCNTMWSLAQQYSYLRLSDVAADRKATLVDDHAVRARRIAATYARFYLEQEEGGDITKKGRFYWMAIGAFASKTVACALEDLRIALMGVLPKLPEGAPPFADLKTVKDGLGKGNFWLFCDISGWHWYYCKYGASFDMCLDGRNATQYAKPVQAQVAKLPWNEDALPKIKNLAVSKEIKAGFALVKQFEDQPDAKKRPAIQLKHLLEIANHEQGVILQPLIYDDPKFAWWIKAQRSAWVNWASPDAQLVFSSACSTDDPELTSLAPGGTKLEDFESRMTWIQAAAGKFHRRMQTNANEMEAQLRAIAGWVNLPDR